MVRLQRCTVLAADPVLPVFQSHYGAIATLLEQAQEVDREFFQSHYGAIATVEKASIVNDGFSLSIPLWCDCNLRRA